MKTKHLSQRPLAVVLTIMLLLVAIPANIVFAATSGPNFPGTASGSGWTSPTSIGADDTNYATYTIPASGTSTALNGSSYGFAIPSGSTIDGITVVIGRASSSNAAGDSINDSVVQLLKAGVATGNNEATTTDWPTSQGTATYGGAADLWGTTWTADDINNTNFGVTLSALNESVLLSRTASVDYMRITVNYTLPTTTTTVDCVANPITFGGNTTCTATVTRSAGTNTPAGSVSWATDASGSFVTSPCTLAGAGAAATCSITYTPSSVGDGTHLITATYAGNTNFSGSNGNQTVTVNKATPTISVTNSPVTYNGSPQAATVTGSVSGVVTDIKYNGSSTVPTNAGTYAVTADFVASDPNYNTLADASAGNFVIDKVTPTVSVTNSPVTYNGSPQAATVTGSVSGTVSNILYDGSATAPTNAGTYAVTADFAPTDSTNYNTLADASAGNFVINEATPTISVTNSPVIYNGSPQAATVTGSVAGVVSDIKYNGSATVPTNAGTYAITADFAPTDSTNYNTLADASAGNFVIDKVTPTVSVTNSPVTYDGSPQAATVTGSVAGVVSDIKYNGFSTAPTNAGTYAVTADFAPTDSTNYNTLADASAGNFVIDKATPTVSVTNSPVTYNGSPQAATVTGSVAGVVSNVQYDGFLTEPTNAGTYPVTADFAPTDTTNYNSLISDAAGNFVIDKATPTVSVTNSPVIYNGSPQAATVTGSVAGVVSNVQYDGSATEPTNVGTYAVTADFAPTDTANYNNLISDEAGNFVIDKATPTVSVTNSPVTYNGSPQAATVTGSVAGVVSNVQYDGSATEPTNVGTYAVTADFAPTDTTNYNNLTGDAAGNFVINNEITPPTVLSSVRASTNPTSAASVDFTVTFSEAVTGVDVTDFVLTTTGAVSGATVDGVSGSGTTYTVTVGTGSGDGTTRLDVLDDNTIIDAVSNPLAGGFTGGEVYTIIKSSPFANVQVNIAGNSQGNFNVAPKYSMRQSFAGVNNGPVSVQSTNTIPIVASERVAYFDGSAWTSYSELMGLPSNQLTTSYTFPWYNNVDLNSQLRFGNVGTSNTTVTVTIAGIFKGSYQLIPNESKRISYVGLNEGPVKVTSSGNVPIIASMRVAYFDGSAWTSFSEMMGLPSNKLTNSYVFPWYNNLDLNSQLRFGNVGTTPTTVTVTINGVVKGTYNLAPNTSQRVSYPGLDKGPVKVTSSGNVPIIASMRVAYFDGSAWTDFSEMMGLPSSSLSTHYSFPAYNNVNLNTQLRFGNVGTSPTTVTVTINGVLKGSYNLAPNASQRISYVGLNSGPVVIQSSGGVPIIASERVAYFDGSAWTSFAEMMGLPQSQLTTTYVFPWYNNVDINSQLRFGIP